MFDGRDYHQAFREARDELAVRVLDRDEVLGQLDTRVNLARAGVEAAIALIFQHHHSVAGDHGHIRGPQ
jgi:hypothetical protein